MPSTPDVHTPPPATACLSHLHNYICHKLDWHLHKTATQSGPWALHTRNIRQLNTGFPVNYRSSLGLQKMIRLQITLITRWRYFIALHLCRWWTCLARLSSTIMMLRVTAFVDVSLCTIYQHTLSFYLPPPEYCHRSPTKQPPTTSLREIRQMSSRRVCVWKHKLIYRWNHGLPADSRLKPKKICPVMLVCRSV